MNIVGVLINRPSFSIDKVFHYAAEDDIYKSLEIGSLVLVPFGKGNNTIEGFVISFPEKTEIEKLKNISAILSDNPLFNKELLDICFYMQKKYFCTLINAVKAVIPPGRSVVFTASNDKYLKGSRLAVSESDAFELLENIRNKAPVQAKIIELLLQIDFAANSDIKMFTGCSDNSIKSLKNKAIIEEIEIEIFRNPIDFNKIKPSKPLCPTNEQRLAIDSITQGSDKFNIFLLYGVTGSGKTEVFLQCIKKIIDNGKTAIVLVPEISLTPQMVERFASRFGKRIAVLHSRLSLGERNDEYKRIKNNEVDVVIGVRSAIFAPIENLGIIIVDEEHETSYKSESSPMYHAREIAEFRAYINNIPLVLASATPSVESFYKASSGEYKLLRLAERANKKSLPNVKIVDMRNELLSGNRTMFSQHLIDEITKNLENKQQTILFLNRRGFSTFVSCRKCGYVVKCKNCNVALTYHKNKDYLSCHYCGYTIKNYILCPECGSGYIKHFGTGTQKIEEQIHEMFPSASILRMDFDTTTKKTSHQEIIHKFESEGIDILIGTQMVTKGLDFPNVTLVGVLAADMSLNIDDFKANERSFDLITQVCGRAGRGDIEGRAVIQSYAPESNVLSLASAQNYEDFYNEEIAIRKSLNYPPFSDLISVLMTSVNEGFLINYSKKISIWLKKYLENSVVVLGPVAAPLSKINNKYRYRILLKCNTNDKITEILRNMICSHSKSKNSKLVNLSVEINPNSML